MSNVAGKAYGMNVLTPMRPWLTWVNRFTFMIARVVPSGLTGTPRALLHPFRALDDHQARAMAGDRNRAAQPEGR